MQALAHGTTQGTLTAIQGGKFWTGFAAGSLSSVMSSLWQGGEHITDNGKEMVNGIGGANPGTVGTMFFGTISGGAGAAISGGNFWQGAVTGLVVSGLNHLAHRVSSNIKLSEILENSGIDPDGVPAQSEESLYNMKDSVCEFSEMYSEMGNPELIYDPNDNTAYGRTYRSEHTFDKNGDMKAHTIKKITFSKHAFESNLRLASTMGHEFTHGVDFVSGNFASWFNQSKSLPTAYRMTELKAHGWQISHNAPVNIGRYLGLIGGWLN